MGMIRLNNVSKYYYSKGIIASGISRVNLDIDAYELVLISGESGSSGCKEEKTGRMVEKELLNEIQDQQNKLL